MTNVLFMKEESRPVLPMVLVIFDGNEIEALAPVMRCGPNGKVKSLGYSGMTANCAKKMIHNHAVAGPSYQTV